jgi:EAL domain-containing protein (putative c-di-GMP-specific phosphodiesterase class I)
MRTKILAVAGPEWQAALQQASLASGIETSIETQNAANAVIALATHPTHYGALALDPAAGGAWLETLIDLTLGDTDHTVPLFMLGDQKAGSPQLNGTPSLTWPIDAKALSRALDQAANHYPRPAAEQLPDPFSNLDSIRVRYQPVVRLRDSKPTTVEVLARLITRTGETLGPGAIINAMTDGDHAIAITSFILKLGLKERQRGEFDNLDLKVAFNLPLDAILHPKILPALEAIRKAGKIPEGAIKLELTETQPVSNTAALNAVISKLSQAGYRLALDDITPATANLEALLELPFRAVKLDRSVVANAQHYQPATAAAAQSFITKITTQAASINRAVIAEGIENATTLALVKSLGATHGQGYLFARPLPARALGPWLTHWRSETGV